MPTKNISLLQVGIVLILLGIFTGCTPTEDIRLTGEDNGKQVEIAKGQVLVLTLESNATTGYEWDIAEFDDQILVPQGGPEYIAPDTDLVGAGGQEVYRFECVGSGQTTLQLIYHQPFEDADPAETFTLEITAK